MMARTSTYLNFPGKAEQAFSFYRSVFGGEFTSLVRYSQQPPKQLEVNGIKDSEKNLIFYIELPIPGNHLLMGADVPESAGLAIRGGNKMHVALWFDDDEEAQALEICKRFLPDYGNSFGGTSFRDNFGVNWIINCGATPQVIGVGE
jgi:PhnB protein